MNKKGVAVIYTICASIILAGLFGCVKYNEHMQQKADRLQEKAFGVLGIKRIIPHSEIESFSRYNDVSYGYGPGYDLETQDLIQAISGGRLGRFNQSTSTEDKHNKDYLKYVRIIPIDLESYDDWIPSNDKVDYSLDNITKYLESNTSIKNETGMNVEKASKNELDKFNYPESAIVQIDVELTGKLNDELDAEDVTEHHYGTGVMINKDTVLTCAHNFYLDGERRVPRFVDHTYLYRGSIDNVQVRADMSGSSQDDSLCASVDRIYIPSVYVEAINVMKRANTVGCYFINYDDEDTMKRMFENAIAILKLKKTEGKNSYLGEETGWVGVIPYEVAENQKLGNIYGYPEIVPELPNLESLVESFKVDAKATNSGYRKNTRGISIRLIDAIKAMKNEYKSRPHYANLLKRNDMEMYKRQGEIKSTSEFPKLLEYDMMTYSGDSGAPIIQSIYDKRSDNYTPYVSGIHCGYVVEGDSLNNDSDLDLYVLDRSGEIIDFKQEYDTENLEGNGWNVKLEMLGHNCGRQIDKALYNYMLANDFYPGYAYVPENRKVN